MIRLRAESAVYGGYTIARTEGVVFIKGALPGETVDVEVAEKKKDYSVANVLEVVEPSPFRVEPECPHYGVCGGCQLQYMSYAEQVRNKDLILAESLKRLGGIEAAPLEPITGNPHHYRRRAQLKISAEGRAGFFRESSREVIDIKECLISTPRINETISKIKSIDLRGIREMHITEGDELVVLIKGRGFDESLAEEFVNAGFSGVAFEDRSHRGKGHAEFDLRGLRYTVSPWSFFQSNWELNLKVIDALVEGLAPIEGMKILDAYAGGGNFSLPLAASAERVLCIEENPHSVKDGLRNVEFNGLKNVRFIKSGIEKCPFRDRRFDIVLLDPPRPGLTGEAMKRILELAPERIVYISCNPATLARDLKKMAGAYKIDSVRVADFFPDTYHIEAVCFLSRIK